MLGRWFFAAACLSTIAACGSARDEPIVRRASSPIVKGAASTADDDAAVLILTHDESRDTAQGKFYLNCTGTLLAPNLVLTARHCVSPSSDGVFTCDAEGNIASGTGGKVGADLPPGESWVLAGPKLPDAVVPESFPGQGASYVHDGATVTCNADVALIVLAEPIPNATIAPIRLDAPVTKNEALFIVGWGATETTFIPTERQRRDGVTAVSVGPDTTPFIGGELGDKEFIASESVCGGDSGGPAFDATTKAVVGVVSRGSNGGVTKNGSGCVGTQHVFMQTASFKSLVMDAFAKANAVPWLEGQPKPDALPKTEPTPPTPGKDAGAPADPAPADATSSSSSSGCATAPGSTNPFALLAIATIAGLVMRRRAAR